MDSDAILQHFQLQAGLLYRLKLRAQTESDFTSILLHSVDLLAMLPTLFALVQRKAKCVIFAEGLAGILL